MLRHLRIQGDFGQRLRDTDDSFKLSHSDRDTRALVVAVEESYVSFQIRLLLEDLLTLARLAAPAFAARRSAKKVSQPLQVPSVVRSA